MFHILSLVGVIFYGVTRRQVLIAKSHLHNVFAQTLRLLLFYKSFYVFSKLIILQTKSASLGATGLL